MCPPTWQQMPRSTGTSMIRCSVSSWIVSPGILNRDSRTTPLNFAKSAGVPLNGASPSLTVGVAGSSTGVLPVGSE